MHIHILSRRNIFSVLAFIALSFLSAVHASDNVLDKGLLLSMSPEELKGYALKMQLINSILSSNGEIDLISANLQEKKQQIEFNSVKREEDLKTLKRHNRLNEKFEEQERLASLIEKKVHIAAFMDKSKEEITQLKLANISKEIELEEKKIGAERSMFGTIIKGGFYGKKLSTDLKGQLCLIADQEKERQSALSIMDNMISSRSKMITDGSKKDNLSSDEEGNEKSKINFTQKSKKSTKNMDDKIDY